jgi:predicted DNA-binding ribbon-helix-helix protein
MDGNQSAPRFSIRARESFSGGSGNALKASLVVKRSVAVAGHKTSVSLEEAFWRSLKQISDGRSLTVSELVGEIDQGRGARANLSSAIRLFVLAHYRQMASKQEARSIAPTAPATSSFAA